MMIESRHDIDDSDNLQLLFGSAPSRLIRWGSFMVFIFVVLMSILGFVIRYPDIIVSRVVITTRNPPIRLTARTNGRVISKWVNDGEFVDIDQDLLLIGNEADYKDILFIIKQINYENNRSSLLKEALEFAENDLQLGSVQNDFSTLTRLRKEYRILKDRTKFRLDSTSLKSQILYNQTILQSELRRLELFEDELKLIKSEYNRNSHLYSSNSIALKDFEISKRQLLSGQQLYEEYSSNITQIRLKISDFSIQLNRLLVEQESTEMQIMNELIEARNRLNFSIVEWKHKYLIRAPISGKITFSGHFWSENQTVTEGLELMTIIPTDNSEIFGRVSMPIVNSGKVAIGQRVNIFLDNYPSEEFGALEGSVSYIGLVPGDNNYQIEVQLDYKNLTTTFGKNLAFKQELTGIAEIVTEELNLITRVFYSLKKNLKRY